MGVFGQVFTDPGFLGAFFQTVIIILIGYIFSRKQIISEAGQKAITSFVWKIAIPCLAFHSFMSDFDTLGLARGFWVVVLTIAAYLVLIFGSRLFMRKLGKKRARILSYFVALGQVTLFALPLMESMYNGNTAALLSVNLMAVPFRVTLYSAAFLAAGGDAVSGESFGSRAKKILLNPIMIAMFLGLIVWLTQNIMPKVTVYGVTGSFLRLDISLPVLYKVVKTLSSTVSPLAMFLIGYSLGKTSLTEAFHDKVAVTVSVVRSVAAPLVGFGLALLLQLTGLVSLDEYTVTALVLGLGAPASASLGVFCIRYQNEELTASRICALTALCCLVTVPLSYVMIRTGFALQLF